MLGKCMSMECMAKNRGVGNDKDFLIRVGSQCLPYIGYPRSLNAISCIQKAAE